MAKKSQMTQVGKRKLEISNLDKPLWPEDGIVKAELIEYYLKIAPTILRHIKGRPLSFVRFPDGIHGESFFQKNRPDWAPAWLEHEKVGDEDGALDYVFASEEASMVWIGNHACMELHQIHARRPHFDKPDYMVFDLDPPEGFPFVDVVELAFELKEHVESHGYHTFAKTTGRKGIHIVAPVEPKWSFDEVFQTAKGIAQPFVRTHASSTTLHINKEARQGRVLVDVFRNRPAQTIVAPYSVRGSAGAPVSTPLTWEDLEGLEDPREFNLRTVFDRVVSEGDPWEALGAYAVALHTQRKAPVRKRAKTAKSRTHKTPEQLEDYEAKRAFEKTPEPKAELVGGGGGNAFVVHRHHASRLHYDLRLEKDGSLQSWAIPKGLPPRPGIKRLALKVEDHPLEYLTFEGRIPKGEYGAGPMWVYAQGRYEITVDKPDSFYFRLQSREINAEYRLINTKGKDWLLERLDSPQVDWLNDTIEPMLAESCDVPPVGGEYVYEVKWDGIRALIALEEGEVRIRTRSQRDVTAAFPELASAELFRGATGLFDGEIVCLDDAGKPVFTDVMGRIHAKGEAGIARSMGRHPAVCYLFDCLYLDGRPIVTEPMMRRHEWLESAIKPDGPFRVSEVVEEGGQELFEAARTVGIEGIVAKTRDGSYLPGRRSESWLKVKVRRTMECQVLGYTSGKGDRQSQFGALHLGKGKDGANGGIQYLGKVGNGFDDKTLKSIFSQLVKMKETKRPIDHKPADDAETIWIEPVLICEVQYASLTNTGTLREGVFLRMRPDLELVG